MSSTRYIALSDFFGTVPRTYVLESCIQADAFHHMPGDEYDYDGAPNPTMVATVVRKWATASGGLFYARYRLDGHLRKRYDAVAGKDVFMPPTTLDGLSLLQFAWLPAAGRNGIGDAHPAQDTDLSTITSCYTGSGELIRQ